MAHHIEYTDTTNRQRGTSGGFTAEKASEVSRRKVPASIRGEDKSGDPFSTSTTHFQDDKQQVVKRRSMGSGDE